MSKPEKCRECRAEIDAALRVLRRKRLRDGDLLSGVAVIARQRDEAEAELKRLRAKLRKAKRPGKVLARGWWCPHCRMRVQHNKPCPVQGAKVIRVEVREAEGGR